MKEMSTHVVHLRRRCPVRDTGTVLAVRVRRPRDVSSPEKEPMSMSQAENPGIASRRADDASDAAVQEKNKTKKKPAVDHDNDHLLDDDDDDREKNEQTSKRGVTCLERMMSLANGYS